MDEKELLKLVRNSKRAINENLLESNKVEALKKNIADFLKKNLKESSLLRLRFNKVEASPQTLWSDPSGYPNDAKEYLKPWLTLLEGYFAEKTIKLRFRDEEYWVETRQQGETSDLHILVGALRDKGEKVHFIIDADTGELRVEASQKLPEELAREITVLFTLPDGSTIKTTRQLIEKLDLDETRLAKDETYSMNKVICRNCKYEGAIKIPVGTALVDARCDACGNHGTLQQKP